MKIHDTYKAHASGTEPNKPDLANGAGLTKKLIFSSVFSKSADTLVQYLRVYIVQIVGLCTSTIFFGLTPPLSLISEIQGYARLFGEPLRLPKWYFLR